MMKEKIRWAILGAGKIAHSFVKDFSEVQNAQIVAVASADAGRAAAFADAYNIPERYTYDQLYASTTVDAVYIATTHNFHYEQCKKCLLAGKAVLCEKPVTLNDRQFKELMTIAKEQQVFFMEAMWTCFLPPVRQALQWLQQGKIGELKVIDACFGFPMEKRDENRLYNIALAGGALLDLGVYPVALATLVTDLPPINIMASAQLTHTKVDERTGIVIQYGPITANLFTSMVNIMSNKAYLYGEKGYIEIPDFFKATSAFLYDDHHNLLEKMTDDRITKGYNFETQHATDCILQQKVESEIVPHWRSNRVQEIMTEVRRQIGLEYPGEHIL